MNGFESSVLTSRFELGAAVALCQRAAKMRRAVEECIIGKDASVLGIG